MAIKREYGQEQPYTPLGIFKLRLPFIHYKWEWSEAMQAILMCYLPWGYPYTDRTSGDIF